ncbi:MAG TPA: M3 family metallopeptidase, partial [Burkholderiaceae bacterium]|nr:M3 family metallopeptidase [Burkholderiaceae bacterium]
MNPLLARVTDLIAFDQIRPEHVAPAIDTLLEKCQAVLNQVTAPEAAITWESIVAPLDDATEQLSRAWGAVSHLNAVADTPELRAAYNATEPKLTAFWTALAQNEALFAKYKALAQLPEFPSWPPARQRVIENELRDFRLGGAELTAEDKVRFSQIQERKAELSTHFSQHVLDAVGAYALYITDESELAGIPSDTIALYREAAQAKGKPGYKITLQYPSYLPLMQYAHKRELRETLYRAWVTRNSELADAKWDNSALMTELLQLRFEQAQLLGLPDYTAYSLERKMASSSDEVLGFLRDLAQRAKPSAQRDLQEVREFAAKELGLPQLEAWDLPYASERLREQRYAYSENEVKQYFTLPKVLDGLFNVAQRLFGVRIEPDTAPAWHPDVRFYRVQSAAGELIGQFYLDLYAREHKQGGAWQDDARSRHRSAQGLHTPVSFLICNFSRPTRSNGTTKPAVLTHDDVLTLFHEFGHGLHHMLTRVDELSVSGIHGVEWDAVELPSQFMENFAWEWEVVSGLSAHVDTGEPLPRALYDRLLAGRNFQSGLQMLRQI